MVEAPVSVSRPSFIPRKDVHALVVVCDCEQCQTTDPFKLLERLQLHPGHTKFYKVPGGIKAIVVNGAAGLIRKKLAKEFTVATKVVVVGNHSCLHYDFNQAIQKKDLVTASRKIDISCTDIRERKITVEPRHDTGRTIPERIFF